MKRERQPAPITAPPGGVVVGWRPREWTFPVLCARCRRITTKGVTHVNDHEDPPHNALCHGCFDFIMSLGPDERDPGPNAN